MSGKPSFRHSGHFNFRLYTKKLPKMPRLLLKVWQENSRSKLNFRPIHLVSLTKPGPISERDIKQIPTWSEQLNRTTPIGPEGRP